VQLSRWKTQTCGVLALGASIAPSSDTSDAIVAQASRVAARLANGSAGELPDRPRLEPYGFVVEVVVGFRVGVGGGVGV
jgi:hypothetical protein